MLMLDFISMRITLPSLITKSMSTTAGFPNTKPLSSSLVHLSTLAPNSFSAISFTAFLKDSSLNILLRRI
jgi:hypothetical protein